MKKYMADLATIIRDEFRTISTSYSILLVLMGGIFAYGLLYNYMYAPDVVRNAPVAVVDNSRTELSRRFVSYLDATPQVDVFATAADYIEAQTFMKQNSVVGIVYIPDDFERRLSLGQQSVYVMYETTSAFLYYMSMQEASSAAMLGIGNDCRPGMLVFLPARAASQLLMAQPVTVVGTALYNHTEGYGSYLIPAVLIVIIFQTLMMLIGMISGKERETGSVARFAAAGLSLGRMARVVAGKTFVYFALYAVFCLFLVGLIPLLFGMPALGDGMQIVMLLIPFILASSFLGLTASVFFTDSEAPLLMIAFFSVGLVFLSGVSYPLELMPWYWRAAHYLLPVAPATLGYVQLNSMGASLNQIAGTYAVLWVQTLVYFVTACVSLKHTVSKAAVIALNDDMTKRDKKVISQDRDMIKKE